MPLCEATFSCSPSEYASSYEIHMPQGTVVAVSQTPTFKAQLDLDFGEHTFYARGVNDDGEGPFKSAQASLQEPYVPLLPGPIGDFSVSLVLTSSTPGGANPTVPTSPGGGTPILDLQSIIDDLDGGQVISSFSNNGGNVQVNLSSAHSLSATDEVRIDYATPDDGTGNYRGTQSVLAVVSSTAFTINDTWVSDDSTATTRYGQKVSEITNDGSTVVTNELGGVNTLKCQITNGDTGFGRWGFIWDYPSDFVQGEELWVSAEVYFPAASDMTAPGEGGWLKFMRHRTENSGGVNQGYMDYYVDIDSGQPTLRIIKEGVNVWATEDTPTTITDDVWHQHEFYAYFDATGEGSGGDGVSRVWYDGTLEVEYTNATLADAAHLVKSFYFGTYWNGASLQDNHIFVRNLKIYSSDSPPTNTDASGNVFIGA